MAFDFKEIEVVESLSKEDFINRYYKPQKPVVVKQMTKEWPAFEKWNFEYLKSLAGDIEVPLYNNEPVKGDDKFNEPKARMRFADYIDLLKKGPTDLRIFLFNIMKEIPQLKGDFRYPSLGMRIMKGLPMLFFGGSGSNVFMHYDIDLANILHFHFEGKKECILVPPHQTKFMYKIPNATICREDIDFDHPDFEKWPALKEITPYIAHLEHGDMLYMPEGWWHYMKYITPGFSMSLRSMAKNPSRFAQALYNVFFMRHYDNFMRNRKGQEWIDLKNRKAVEKTHKTLSLS